MFKDETEKKLRLQTAKLEDDVDGDWRLLEDQVDKLESYVNQLDAGLIQDAVGLVVVQVYLNRMRRAWDGLEEPENDDGITG